MKLEDISQKEASWQLVLPLGQMCGNIEYPCISVEKRQLLLEKLSSFVLVAANVKKTEYCDAWHKIEEHKKENYLKKKTVPLILTLYILFVD